MNYRDKGDPMFDFGESWVNTIEDTSYQDDTRRVIVATKEVRVSYNNQPAKRRATSYLAERGWIRVSKDSDDWYLKREFSFDELR